MNRLIATVLINFFCLQSLLGTYSLDLGGSSDYFRGLPEGSWNGNNGLTLSANSGFCVYDTIGLQVGGSYGLYNGEGRENVRFASRTRVQQIGFVTAGAYRAFGNVNAGVVYDRLMTSRFSIFDVSPSLDQIRFQVGYALCNDEVGIWGTHHLATSHHRPLGLPLSFRAIDQLSLFWSHFYQGGAKTTVWVGMPYGNSLMFSKGKAGNVIVGFSFRALLIDRLFFDGYGSYMAPKDTHRLKRHRNYGASLSFGLTYCFNDGDCSSYNPPYMSLANHSNFFVDTNYNQ